MSSSVTIIMYHYVRDLRHSRYPEIKALELHQFREQVDFLTRNYQVIRMEELIGAIESQAPLPPRAALLAFDDGYMDHFINAFPILDEKRIQGSFFPVVKAVKDHRVLDVNKIHFILASVPDKDLLIRKIFSLLDAYRTPHSLKSNKHYYEKLARPYRYDTPEVVFIKRMLQVELEEALRKKITDQLFREFVSGDEEAFSHELYMGADQLTCLLRHGMHVGSHGVNHYWLGSLTPEKQEEEIRQSREFILGLGADPDNWTMCYPYGDHNQDTARLLGLYGCKLGMTTRVEVCDIRKHGRFELPRVDTNDLCPVKAL